MKNKRIIVIISVILLFGLFAIYNNKENDFTIINSKIDIKDSINNRQSEHKSNNNKINSINNDIIGNIIIKGTRINEEIVQGEDNEFYLNHSPTKIKDSKGSIFMDYRNNLDDRKLLIYGHNSKTLNTALFHDLEKYIDSSFYKDYKYIELTLNNEKSTYEIFSVMIIESGNNTHMKITFNDNEFLEHINWMKKESLYKIQTEVDVNDKIITLQTCYYNPDDSYLIINAKKIK